MHPFLWNLFTWDDATARQTLIALHHCVRQHPEIVMIGMHDAETQETFMLAERQMQVVKR
ncbi:MAG: hypothetical protein NVSMB33_06410 [Ktedonobacteraceae bacterium]